jgi:hypothetical protein
VAECRTALRLAVPLSIVSRVSDFLCKAHTPLFVQLYRLFLAQSIKGGEEITAAAAITWLVLSIAFFKNVIFPKEYYGWEH